MANIKAYYVEKSDVENALASLPFDTEVEERTEDTLYIDFPSGKYPEVVQALEDANIEHE